MSWTLAGQLAHRGGKCLQIVGPPNLRRCRDWRPLKLRRLCTGGLLCSSNTNKEELSQTTIMAQSGPNIQELPVIIRKAKLISLNEDFQTADQPHKKNELLSVSEESVVFLEELKRCRTLRNLHDSLLNLPQAELSPVCAVEALRKVIELENNQHYRRRTPQNFNDDDKSRTSQRDYIVSLLLEHIIPSKDPELILDALKTITRDMTRAASRQNNYWVGHYRSRLSQEALLFATDSKFSISQLCEVVHAFAYLDAADSDQIDLLWVGFEAKANEINEHNIVEVVRVLPYLKKGRRIVLSVVENSFEKVCSHVSGTAVGEILTVLQICKEENHTASPRLLEELSLWVSRNMRELSEDELIDIVRAFSGLEYSRPVIVHALEEYVKSHNKNTALIASVMEFCSRFRVRSRTILENCAIHFINNAHNLTPVELKAIFVPFGLLHYYPAKSSNFLQAVDTAFRECFVRFRPEDAIDVILSCIFLEHYPIQFATKIFNSSFLDRLESNKNVEVIRGSHTKLKLYDMAMTLECEEYDGPLLPRDSNVKSMWVDGRLRRIVSHIIAPLEKLTNDEYKVSQFVLLPEVPAVCLYVLDILLHPLPASTKVSEKLHLTQEERDSCLAFLIHLPEHYCAEMHYLNGPQRMRHRHFRKLGIKCVEIRYDILAKLRLNPETLEKYLSDRLKAARNM